MTNKQILCRFKKDCGLSGTHWKRFCKRYVSRNVTTVMRFIRVQYGDVPSAFREHLIKEMRHGCGRDKKNNKKK